jgi:hypothetical protein
VLEPVEVCRRVQASGEGRVRERIERYRSVACLPTFVTKQSRAEDEGEEGRKVVARAQTALLSKHGGGL